MKNATATEKVEAPGFFDCTEIPLQIGYSFLPGEPMEFYLRLQMAKEEREARQKLFALPAEEQEAKKHQANVELIASLSTRPPKNVPTFEPGEDWRKSIKEFFAGDNAMKQKVVEDVITAYYTRSQPVDFFR